MIVLRKVAGRFEAVRRAMRSLLARRVGPSIAAMAYAIALLFFLLAPYLAARSVIRRLRDIGGKTVAPAVIFVNPFVFVVAGGGGGVTGFSTITIDHTKCGSNDSTDFPVAIIGTYTALKGTGSGGTLTSVNNVAFYSDAGHTTLLKFERVIHDLTTGTIEYHVKVPTLSHSVDTVIYPFVDTTNTTDRSDPTAVWDSHFLAVYHFPDGTTLSYNDSTANAYHGTTAGFPTAATGKVGGAARFPGAGSPSQITNSSFTLAANSDITISFWNKVASGANSTGTLDIGRDPSGADAQRCVAHVPYVPDGNLYWDYGNYNSNGRLVTSYTSYLNAWTHVTLTGKGDHTGKSIRLNGSVVASGGASNAPTISLTILDIGLAAFGGGIGNFWHGGDIDEFRVSDVVRSTDWTLAEYNNQNDPASFYTVA